MRVFHTSVSRWFLTGVWVTTSLLSSPRLFSVFWPISVISKMITIFQLKISFINTTANTLLCLLLFTSISAHIYLSIYLSFGWSPLILLFPRPFINPLVTVPSVPITIGITITFILRVFHTSVKWCSFSGAWVTASLLRSPGLLSVSVFWPILTSFDGSRLSSDFQLF